MKLSCIIICSLAVCLCACTPRFNASPEPYAHISLTDLDGNHHRLSDYSGKVVIVHFWSSWCGMCKAAFKPLKQLQDEIGAENLEVLTVGVDDSTRKLRKAAEQEQVPFPVLIDSAGKLKQEFNITTVPTGIVIDTHGEIAAIPDPDSGIWVKSLEGPKWWYKDSIVKAIRALL